MILIAGLGNSGEQFKNTRHNIGREVLELFRKEAGLPDFRFEKKYNARISAGKIGKEKVLLACPDCFVNKSGGVIAPLARFFKIKTSRIFLIHDDADVDFGRTKLSFAKRSAGHKGVESVIKALKTRDFWRLRIGVGDQKNTPAEKTVLKKFSQKEAVVVKRIIKKTILALDKTIEAGPEKAMNEYNR